MLCAIRNCKGSGAANCPHDKNRLDKALLTGPHPPDTDQSLRYRNTGWLLIAMHDPVGRRGVWARVDRTQGIMELCAGREGDDAYLKIPLDAWQLEEFATVVGYATWYIELEDDARIERTWRRRLIRLLLHLGIARWPRGLQRMVESWLT